MSKKTIQSPYTGLFQGRDIRIPDTVAPSHLDNFVYLRDAVVGRLDELASVCANHRNWLTEGQAEILSNRAGIQTDLVEIPFKDAVVCPIEQFKRNSYDIAKFKYGEESQLLDYMKQNGEIPILTYQKSAEVYAIRSPDVRKGWVMRTKDEKYIWGYEFPFIYFSFQNSAETAWKLLNSNSPVWVYPILSVCVSETPATDAMLRQVNLIDWEINRAKRALFPEFAFTMQWVDQIGNTRYYLPNNSIAKRYTKKIYREMTDEEIVRWRFNKVHPVYYSSMFHCINNIMVNDLPKNAPDILETLTVRRYKLVYGKPYQVEQYTDEFGKIQYKRLYSNDQSGKLDNRVMVKGVQPKVYGSIALENLKLNLGYED